MQAAQRQVHEVAAGDVFDLLQSRSRGLTDAEAAARFRAVGSNRLESASRTRWAKLLLKHFVNFFSLLLDVAAAVCFLAEALQPGEGMATLGWALLAVSVVNALFAFAQEMRAERAMEELRKFLPQTANVRRNGRIGLIRAERLVPGDVVLLAEGDRIPADARLVETEDLLVNKAPLTGESRSQPLVSGAARGLLLDSPNIVFAGCSVVRGRGTAVVFATGHRTEFGKIAAMSRDVRRPPSPIQRETTRMIRMLTIVAFAMGALFFAYGVASGRSWWVNLVFMMGIIVANVPEGLLPTFTLAMSMASLRMARKNVLVKSLEAVESLGTVHVICTDKTGTLTKGRLAIASSVDPLYGDPLVDPAAVREFLKAALVASEVRPQEVSPHHRGHSATEAGRPHWAGDPLDVVIAQEYARVVGDPTGIISETRRHFPFDLEKRREAGLCANQHEVMFAVKGAWESLRPLIGSIRAGPDEQKPASSELLTAGDRIVQGLSSQAYRVIAVACRKLAAVPEARASEESLEQSLVLLGFLTLVDPLRDEVPDAIARCQRAGVQVMMITGDHPETGLAIARQCGILAADDPAEDRILVGSELMSLQPDQLLERLRSGVSVFARTTPEQKLSIVTALKRLDYVVAMTGDGVNDAPALKAADVGIAMSLSGTDVAREAADIVLLDDHFASIVAGIEEGRAVFANLQKFTTYVLASNIPEIVPLLVYIALPVPLALTVIQILSIDLGTDLLPAIGLGQEPPERDVMACKPRSPQERLLSRGLMATAYLFLGLIQAAWSLTMFFLVLHQGGWVWGQELGPGDPLYRSATGITLATVVLMQIGNVIGRRSLRCSGADAGLFQNRLLMLGIAVEILFSWSLLYVEPLQTFLGTGPVAWHLYALAWLGIPLLFLLDLGRKQLLAAR
jgi:sodium/potassium-transporting ATPase subunit alpha